MEITALDQFAKSLYAEMLTMPYPTNGNKKEIKDIKDRALSKIFEQNPLFKTSYENYLKCNKHKPIPPEHHIGQLVWLRIGTVLSKYKSHFAQIKERPKSKIFDNDTKVITVGVQPLINITVTSLTKLDIQHICREEIRAAFRKTFAEDPL